MNMIETVSRAFCRGAGLDWDAMPHSNFDGVTVGMVTRLGAINGAKDAINALREPSDAMLAAGVVHDDATYSTWCAMIDAALVEDE